MRFDLEQMAFVEEQREGGKLAVAASDEVLSWARFADRARSLASRLRAAEIPAGHPLLILGHKEAGFIVAIVACLMERIPFVPIDETQVPAERIATLRALTGSVVTYHAASDRLELHGANPRGHLWRPEDPLIYVMFTSGTTGTPKGVQITHAGVRVFARWLREDLGLTGADVLVNQVQLSFDLALCEVVGFLLHGASLVLTSAAQARSTDALIGRIAEFGGSVFVLTPSFGKLCFRDPGFARQRLPSLRTFIFAGEVLHPRMVQLAWERFGARVINAYGPTETMVTTAAEIEEAQLQRYESVPLGRPLDGTRCRIDAPDEEGVGEIMIGGDNVSIGYLGGYLGTPASGEVTPSGKFHEEAGLRWYRTGDFGYLRDELLFFRGRRDDQVKFRGFRIELGEIDHCLLSAGGVALAATLALRDGAEVTRLVAFVQFDAPPAEGWQQVLRQALAKRLPEYCIPQDFVRIDRMPLTATSKVDRKALEERYRGRA